MTIDWASESPYGVTDLSPNVDGYRDGKLVNETEIKCCIADCPHWLQRRRTGQLKSDALFCPDHGISVSTTPTYIFQDYRRNFIIGHESLGRVAKVESWRLGNETSEDALSWNVFVGLLKVGGLSDCFHFLTGLEAAGVPELCVWGNRITLDSAPQFLDALLEVRDRLEPGAGIPTEPDVMLRIPGQAIVLIEAKFGSPNGRFAGKEERFGSVHEYLTRYFARTEDRDPLNRDWISKQPASQVLEQLCRNVIFAHWLAANGEAAFVINLVQGDAETDVESEFRRHLRSGSVTFFRRTWDDLGNLAIVQTDEVIPLRSFLRNKTLRLKKAFPRL